MKNLFFLLLVGLISQACASTAGIDSNNEPLRANHEIEVSKAANALDGIPHLAAMDSQDREKYARMISLFEYVTTASDTMRVNLSIEDAVKLGIEPEVYYEFLTEINNTNQAVKRAKQEGIRIIPSDAHDEYEKFKKQDHIINQNTIKEDSLHSSPAKLPINNGNMSNQTGRITTIDQTLGWEVLYAYKPYLGVNFLCYGASAIVAMHECRTKAGAENIEARIGYLWENISIFVPLAMSGNGYPSLVGYRTSSSNGGTCVWNPK